MWFDGAPRAVPIAAIDAFEGSPVRVRPHEVAVGVERELCGGVTEPGRHRLDVDPSRDPQAGGCVPQIVRATTPARCAPAHAATPVLSMKATTFGCRKEQIVRATPLGPLGPDP